MAQPMRERPDPANGPAYDPTFRVSITDYEPKHKPKSKCKPYYASDDDPATFADPIALVNTFNVSEFNHSSSYVSKLHPYLYGLPRLGF